MESLVVRSPARQILRLGAFTLLLAAPLLMARVALGGVPPALQFCTDAPTPEVVEPLYDASFDDQAIGFVQLQNTSRPPPWRLPTFASVSGGSARIVDTAGDLDVKPLLLNLDLRGAITLVFENPVYPASGSWHVSWDSLVTHPPDADGAAYVAIAGLLDTGGLVSHLEVGYGAAGTLYVRDGEGTHQVGAFEADVAQHFDLFLMLDEGTYELVIDRWVAEFGPLIGLEVGAFFGTEVHVTHASSGGTPPSLALDNFRVERFPWLDQGLAPGDLVVADATGASAFRIHPPTGMQSLIYGGAVHFNTQDVAIGPGCELFLAVPGAGAILGVDPATGTPREVAVGGHLVAPEGVAVRPADGALLVADPEAFGGNGGLVGLDPASGAQTTTYSGGFFVDPSDIAIGEDGSLLVADRSLSGIIRISPMGVQNILVSGSPFEFFAAQDLAVEATGRIVYVDTGRPLRTNDGEIRRIDPTTLVDEQLSAFYVSPHGIAVDSGGAIFVGDQAPPGSFARVYEVDAGTGDRRLVSSGGFLESPRGVAVVPAPEPPGLALRGAALAALLVLASRRARRSRSVRESD